MLLLSEVHSIVTTSCWGLSFYRLLTSPIGLQKRGIFGVPLNVSIKYANVAISLTNDKGESFIYGYVPIVVAKCGVFLKEQGKLPVSSIQCLSPRQVYWMLINELQPPILKVFFVSAVPPVASRSFRRSSTPLSAMAKASTGPVIPCTTRQISCVAI